MWIEFMWIRIRMLIWYEGWDYVTIGREFWSVLFCRACEYPSFLISGAHSLPWMGAYGRQVGGMFPFITMWYLLSTIFGFLADYIYLVENTFSASSNVIAWGIIGLLFFIIQQFIVTSCDSDHVSSHCVRMFEYIILPKWLSLKLFIIPQSGNLPEADS
jgi:hypothetical protein